MFETVKEKLEAHGFTVSVFATGEEASAYLNREIDGVTVGAGGSVTLQQLGLLESLAAHNTFYSHWGLSGEASDRARQQASAADVYLLSANALSESTGEIINIDGTGNRVASSLYGHRKVYFIIGRNKLAPDFHSALHRARNIAGPKNAQRLHVKTPCAVKGDRCYDCASPERICRGLVVLYEKMLSMDMEVVLIDQELGY